MSVFLFLGPTMAADEARALAPGVRVLPPVAHGDLFRLGAVAGDTVILADGYFFQRPAIRHKEIMAVVAAGVRVIGTASMGALRAAELHPYGVRGHGRVYLLYRLGLLTGDDEVAVAHAADGFGAVSEALVNLRFTLRRARRCGLLTAADETRLITAAKRLPFERRRWPDICATAGLTLPMPPRVDAKHADVASVLTRSFPPGRVRPVPETVYVRRWRDAEIERTVGGFALLHPEFAAFHRRVVLAAAGDLGELTAGWGDVRAAGGHWLAEDERALEPDERLRRIVVRTYRTHPGYADWRPHAEALKNDGLYDIAVELSARADDANARLAERGYRPEALPEERLIELFDRRWPGVMPFRLKAADRGLFGRPAFEEIARTFFGLVHFAPEVVEELLAGSGLANPR